jgi:AcrR family transcriptional regulator
VFFDRDAWRVPSLGRLISGRYPRPVETIPGHLERLPSGADRDRAEMLARDPRERILIAMAEIVAKRGYHGSTIEHIVKRAGVSRATFYEHFDNREDCLLAGFDEAAAELQGRMEAAAAEAGDWPDQVRAALAAFLDYAETNPALARTCIVESVTAGPVAMDRYERALRTFVPLFRLGREVEEANDELPDELEDLVIGGLVWMVHQRLLSNEIDQIPKLLPTMLEFALVPYMGEKRAAAVVAQA